jgi:hypothetical protein
MSIRPDRDDRVVGAPGRYPVVSTLCARRARARSGRTPAGRAQMERSRRCKAESIPPGIDSASRLALTSIGARRYVICLRDRTLAQGHPRQPGADFRQFAGEQVSRRGPVTRQSSQIDMQGVAEQIVDDRSDERSSAFGPQRPLAAVGPRSLRSAPPSPLREGLQHVLPLPPASSWRGLQDDTALRLTRRPQGRLDGHAGAPSRRRAGGAVRTGPGPERPLAALGRPASCLRHRHRR